MKRFLSLLFVVLAVAFLSCNKDVVEDRLDVNTTKLSFVATQDSKNLTIYSSDDWSAELENKQDKAWCTITPSKGQAGDYLIVIKVTNNDSTDERNTSVIIKTPTQQKIVAVTQMQKDAIVLAQESYTIGSEGGDIEIEVGHNVEFDVEISDDWISHSATRAFTTERLTFSVAQNTTDENREGTITFISKDKSIQQSVTVLQDYDSTKPRRNEIWYTTVDGNIVEPNTQHDGFGANIISNTYNDGKGVITFDGQVTKIGVNAFRGCSNMATVIIPDSVQEIGNFAFSMAMDGGNLTEVVLGHGLTSIGAYAFYVCSKLTNIQLPNGLKSISHNAFRGCKSLTNVTIPESVEEIGQAAFSNCYNIAFYGKFASADHRYLSIDGTLVAFADAGLTSYTIPDDVTAIGDLSFSSCRLKSLIVPSSVTTIEEEAFFESYLTNIQIPQSVVTIEKGAFLGCQYLTHMTLPQNLSTIEDSVFARCYNMKRINIPEKVTKIGESAFNGCQSLTEITIPDEVTVIGHNAFLGCESLKRIFCKPVTPPTVAQKQDSGVSGPIFDEDIVDRTIYVPASSVDVYKKTYGWARYADDIVGYNF